MNVVFAGECGIGKSSLVNMVIGQDVAKTSNDTTACTKAVRLYKVPADGYNLKLWDTPGLDEGSSSHTNTRASDALVKLLRWLKKNGDIHLLVYCMNGNRAKAALLNHYESIRDSLPPTVPLVAVVTRLERYQDRMENWWSNNAQELASLGMNFADHTCITTLPIRHGLPPAFRERCFYSQRAVRDLIRRNCPSQLLPVRFPVTGASNNATRRQRVRLVPHVSYE